MVGGEKKHEKGEKKKRENWEKDFKIQKLTEFFFFFCLPSLGKKNKEKMWGKWKKGEEMKKD